MTLTAHQVRKACALLGCGSPMLVRRSGVTYTSALKAKVDDDYATLPAADVWAIRSALERAGVIFAFDDEKRPSAVLTEARA